MSTATTPRASPCQSPRLPPPPHERELQRLLVYRSRTKPKRIRFRTARANKNEMASELSCFRPGWLPTALTVALPLLTRYRKLLLKNSS